MVWKILLAAVVFIGLCLVGMCFNILFRKGGKFPESDIGRNPELRKRGIRCIGEDEASLPGGFDCGDCTACDLYKISKNRGK